MSVAAEKIATHPVAATTGGLTGLNAIVFWLANDLLHAGIPAWAAVTVAGGVNTLVAAIGTVGIAGMWRRILHGRDN